MLPCSVPSNRTPEPLEASFRKSKAFMNWDPRALAQYLRCGLRKLPPSCGATSPVPPSSFVTLTTRKHQKWWIHITSNLPLKQTTVWRVYWAKLRERKTTFSPSRNGLDLHESTERETERSLAILDGGFNQYARGTTGVGIDTNRYWHRRQRMR